MTKNRGVLLGFVALIFVAVFFQNCSQPSFQALEARDRLSSQQASSLEEDYDGEEGYDSTVGSDDDYYYGDDGSTFTEEETPVTVGDAEDEDLSDYIAAGTVQYCEVTFRGSGSAKIQVNSQAECLDYYDELKRNNPTYIISKVTLDGKILYEYKEPAGYACQVTIQGAGVVESRMSTESECLSYYAELKRNNPTKTITKVVFNGKTIY